MTTALVDDGMAATPAKTQATLRQYGADELVLVSGGELGFAGREVHASAEEQAELEATFDEIERVARLVVCFGPAGKRVAEGLSARQVRVERVDSLACRLTGTGIISVSGTTTNQTIEISGAGSVLNFDLVSSRCTASISGSGVIETTATESLQAAIAGTGTITYGGNPTVLHTSIAGVGTIRPRY